MPKVTDLKIEWVDYLHDGSVVQGSNLTYRVNGQRRSSRVPWVATSPQIEMGRIERLIRTTEKKKTAGQARLPFQPKTKISTLEDFRK